MNHDIWAPPINNTSWCTNTEHTRTCVRRSCCSRAERWEGLSGYVILARKTINQLATLPPSTTPCEFTPVSRLTFRLTRGWRNHILYTSALPLLCPSCWESNAEWVAAKQHFIMLTDQRLKMKRLCRHPDRLRVFRRTLGLVQPWWQQNFNEILPDLNSSMWHFTVNAFILFLPC